MPPPPPSCDRRTSCILFGCQRLTRRTWPLNLHPDPKSSKPKPATDSLNLKLNSLIPTSFVRFAHKSHAATSWPLACRWQTFVCAATHNTNSQRGVIISREKYCCWLEERRKEEEKTQLFLHVPPLDLSPASRVASRLARCALIAISLAPDDRWTSQKTDGRTDDGDFVQFYGQPTDRMRASVRAQTLPSARRPPPSSSMNSGCSTD